MYHIEEAKNETNFRELELAKMTWKQLLRNPFFYVQEQKGKMISIR